MPLIPDLGIAASVALVVFFIVLGLLVLFIEDIDLKIVLGLLFILLGLTVALLAMGEAGVALIALAAIAALVMDQVFEHFAGV
ncbi:MAG: hypothetical protein E6K10_01965 [Methanobacteriota archaeon]|nr:MAG: hypothetical protein E6K10_01965 [Euryarchaeota archaeon]